MHQVLTRATSDGAQKREAQVHALSAPVTIGALSAIVNGIGSWVATPWGDEAATRSAAERPLPDLLDLVIHRIDAVHAAYYVVVHAFVAVGGPSALVLRLPSVLAVGIATGLVVILGRRLLGPRTGIVAGIIFAILPQVSWAATEARSAALVEALSALVLIAFLRVIRDASPSRRIAFTGASTIAVVVNVYAVLLLLSLLVATVAIPEWRPTWRRALFDCASSVLVASPVIALSLTQMGQVSWLPAFDLGTIRQVVEHQWFGESTLFAVAAWILIVGVAARWTHRRLKRADWTAWDCGIALALITALLPTAVLVLVTLSGKHVYLPRYAVMSLPPVALVVGEGILLIARGRRWLVPAALLVLAALALPGFVAQRQPDAKGNQWAETVAAAEEASPDGQPIYVQDSGNLVAIRILFPEIFEGRPDIGSGTDHVRNDDLWDHDATPATAAARAAAYTSVTVIARTAEWSSSTDLVAFEDEGFRTRREVRFGETAVIEMAR